MKTYESPRDVLYNRFNSFSNQVHKERTNIAPRRVTAIKENDALRHVLESIASYNTLVNKYKSAGPSLWVYPGIVQDPVRGGFLKRENGTGKNNWAFKIQYEN